jgi:transitional endoplasmic reticulum ATPase
MEQPNSPRAGAAPDAVDLSPAQRKAFDEALAAGRPVTLQGRMGAGKSAVLSALHRHLGGEWIDARDLLRAIEGRHPLAAEHGVFERLDAALARAGTVLVDDFHLVTNFLCCGHFYPRQGLLEAVLAALLARAERDERRLVLAVEGMGSRVLWELGAVAHIHDFSAADYEHVCRAALGVARAGKIDFGRVHQFARKLTARQLRRACESLPEGAADTDAFVEHLRARHLVSNVQLEEVQRVELHDLKGIDDVLRALEANVILPLENAELAARYDLRPKRGVLLAGPPGTGKTTVGRALAHRLRSKFFLLDGTAIAGTPEFYERVHRVFEAAKHNAPAVIFIDDSDVVFEGGDMGLYRYLLTMLDGLESESVGRVCVMMTAMDVGSLPPALVRSGRIELWLDMRLPDEGARAAILAERCAALHGVVGPVDVARLAAATEGLSGADLKRLVDDGKLLYAYDVARGGATRPATDYFVDAADVVRTNKARYAEAEGRARAQRGARPSYFDVPGMFAGSGGVVVSGMVGGMMGQHVVEFEVPDGPGGEGGPYGP